METVIVTTMVTVMVTVIVTTTVTGTARGHCPCGMDSQRYTQPVAG